MEEKMTGWELVDMMARSLEGMIIGNSVRAVISLSDLYLPLFYFMRRWAKWNGEENMTALRGAERRDMESLRSVKRSMEQETKKGSCPLAFDRIEFGAAPLQFIESEKKLDETFAYLLRIHSFRQYAGKTVSNNVYMDFDLLCREKKFRRARSLVEREEIYLRIQRHKKRMNPDYDGRVCVETVRCYFKLPDAELEKYKVSYGGEETYAFIMSSRYILGLFTCCEAARQTAVWDGVEYGHLTEPEQKIVRLEGVDGLFQALLLDSVERAGDGFAADLYSVYCLE